MKKPRRSPKTPAGQPCPCGNKAVRWSAGWVCQKCIEIEAEHARREIDRELVRQRKLGNEWQPMPHYNYLAE